MDILQTYKQELDKAVCFFKKDVSCVRTGAANSELIARVLVDVYGVKTPLEQLAALSSPEPRVIVIQPWDKNIVKQIEIALSRLNLGSLPQIDEQGIIRLNLPPLTQENRKNLIKLVNSKLENGRVSLRLARDKARESVIKAEQDKQISQDEKYDLFKDIDKLSNEKQCEIKKIADMKQKQIMNF